MVSAKPGWRHHHHHGADDEAGRYYFPPLALENPRVAQALSFATARGEIDLGAVKSRTSRFGDGGFLPAIAGNVMTVGVPEDDEQDKRMKVIVRNNCTACHTAATCCSIARRGGWSAIVELMKNVNVYGTFVGAGGRVRHPPTFTRRACGLSRKARGPGAISGENGMKVKLEPRASASGTRHVQGIRRSARCRRRLAGKLRAERRQRLVARTRR